MSSKFYILTCEKGFNLSVLEFPQTKKRTPTARVDILFFGLPEGIRTPVLQNRNLLRYPAAPRAEMLSFCFLQKTELRSSESESAAYAVSNLPPPRPTNDYFSSFFVSSLEIPRISALLTVKGTKNPLFV